MSLADKRCYNHPGRQVVFRCPDCGRFYCRECASEYRGRFLCKTCLDSLMSDPEKSRPALLYRLLPGLGFILGLLLTWLVFLGLAQALYTIPSYFHSGFISHEEESR